MQCQGCGAGRYHTGVCPGASAGGPVQKVPTGSAPVSSETAQEIQEGGNQA